VLVEPLSPPDARRLLREILQNGSVAFSRHAEEEMAKDNLTMVDVTNVLRGGVVDPADSRRAPGATGSERAASPSSSPSVRRPILES
jgi:hypothetical protein